ncbi:hypothetical protein QJS10_CPB20g00742 [Acorus calamus]|uniref:Uncharacterized protein n=1 Tax=Acorus calamus TaxID=4465 RepID=A0AAV9CCC2_ACOCL|nr:hypothetical protein QJS10_CPB20g00742 [Acorus calamus]
MTSFGAACKNAKDLLDHIEQRCLPWDCRILFGERCLWVCSQAHREIRQSLGVIPETCFGDRCVGADTFVY